MYLHISQLKRLNNVLQVFTKKLTHSSGNAGIPFDHSLQPFFLPRGKSYYQCGLNYSRLFFLDICVNKYVPLENI